MFDSFAKFKPGIFSEKFADFGHYEQCLGIRNDKFEGRYTLLFLNWPLPSCSLSQSKCPDSLRNRRRASPEQMRTIIGNSSWITGITDKVYYFYFEPMVMAVCVPSTCTNSDLKVLIHSVNQVTNFNVSLMSSESINDTVQSTTLSTVSGSILISLTIVTMVSTAYFWYFDQEESPTEDHSLTYSLFKNFDAISNSRKLLLETRNPKLSFLNGMKFVYLVMCICSHLYLPMTHGVKVFYCMYQNFHIQRMQFFLASSSQF